MIKNSFFDRKLRTIEYVSKKRDVIVNLWCRQSGKSSMITYLSEKYATEGSKILVVYLRPEHMHSAMMGGHGNVHRLTYSHFKTFGLELGLKFDYIFYDEFEYHNIDEDALKKAFSVSSKKKFFFSSMKNGESIELLKKLYPNLGITKLNGSSFEKYTGKSLRDTRYILGKEIFTNRV